MNERPKLEMAAATLNGHFWVSGEGGPNVRDGSLLRKSKVVTCESSLDA
jgi:hypothetical protein